MDIVEGVMRAMTLTADVVMIFPEAENAGLVKTRFRGKCAGAGELVGELPNADAMRLKGSALTFEVHFATDDRGALQLGKFKITLTVEIKYYMSGGGGAIPMSTPAAPPARTSGATGPANLGGEEIAGDLGETVGVARAAVAASTPPDTPPNIYLKSFATLQYPCGLDETQNMDAELAIRFGRVNVENVRAKFVYHCARVGPKLPAFTLVADVGCDDTAEGCKGTDAVEIVPNVLIRNFNVEIKGKFIDGATEYVGKLKGQIAHASASLAFGFDFNTQLGMYGIVTAIVFENEYVKATLDARLRVGGDCGATATASATPGPAALGAAARVRGLVAHLGEKTGMTPEDFQSPADAAPDAMNTLSGKIAMKLPGMTEMTVSVNGHTKCDVEDAREPMVDVVGSMGDVAVAISEDYKLVVKRTGVSLRGYKKRHGAKGASDFKLATPDDFKELSYRVKVRGTLSLTQSTGLPELGAGYDQTDRDEEATEEEFEVFVFDTPRARRRRRRRGPRLGDGRVRDGDRRRDVRRRRRPQGGLGGDPSRDAIRRRSPGGADFRNRGRARVQLPLRGGRLRPRRRDDELSLPLRGERGRSRRVRDGAVRQGVRGGPGGDGASDAGATESAARPRERRRLIRGRVPNLRRVWDHRDDHRERQVLGRGGGRRARARALGRSRVVARAHARVVECARREPRRFRRDRDVRV
jgi:hypothetical protein